MNIQQIDKFLNDTTLILKHKKEKEFLKGETFNIFSILNMERMETKTHTPFLAELLNPNGKHLKGNIFLKLFLETIEYNKLEGIEHLNEDTVTVKINHHIGQVILDEGNESGGSLDIYIVDANNNSITIENKIDEFTEQPKQVVRYCNHNKSKNTVFYLTPFGKEPSPFSKGNLSCNEDFYIISYKTHIIEWLKKCLKESVEQPILRETIKQYIILIQKITFSMENTSAQELNSSMLKHFEEATFISNNFTNLKKQIGEDVRNNVIESLTAKLNNEFNIYAGNNSQIWIKFKVHDSKKLFFGIECFSEIDSSNLKVGVFSIGGYPTLYEFGNKSERSYWPYYDTLSDFEGFPVEFKNSKTLQKLYSDKDFKNRFEQNIVYEIENFINKHKESLFNFLNNS